MIVIVTLLLLTIAGYAVASLDRSGSTLSRLGLAFLLGVCGVGWGMLTLSLVGIEWSRGIVILLITTLGAGGLIARRPRGKVGEQRTRSRENDHAAWWEKLFLFLVVGAALVQVVGYARFATAAPLWEFDFLVNWGLKGQAFFLADGIDWGFLQAVDYRATHPGYPPLLPVIFDLLSYASGSWEGRLIGLVYVGFALAATSIASSELYRATRSLWITSLGGFVFLQLAATPWIGLADGPFLACSSAGVLLLRRGIREDDAGSLAFAGVLVGFAACLKNEGLALVVVVLLVVIFGRPGRGKQVWRVLPGLLLPLPWLIARALYGLGTDLTEGDVAGRIAATLAAPGPLFESLLSYSRGNSLFWIGVVVALGAGAIAARFERLVLAVVAFQLGAYLLAYAASPHDLEWHVRWSWERLMSHVSLLVAFASLVVVGGIFGPPRPKPSETPNQPASGSAALV